MMIFKLAKLYCMDAAAAANALYTNWQSTHLKIVIIFAEQITANLLLHIFAIFRFLPQEAFFFK